MIKVPVKFKYLNHRGILSERSVLFERLEFQFAPPYGYQPGWFLTGFDEAKGESRSFALSRMIFDEPMMKNHTWVLFSIRSIGDGN